MMKTFDRGLAVITGVVVALLLVTIILMVTEQRDCEDSGGEMVGTGEYTTTYVKSGSAIIPFTSENMECSK